MTQPTKTKGGRGGARAGAGRKRKLNKMQRLAIGGAFERVWQRRSERKAMRRHEARLKPFEKAKARLHDSARSRSGLGSDYREELEEEVELSLAPLGRFRTLRLHTPQGEKNRLLSGIARLATKCYGQKISVNRVAECVDEFRQLGERLRSEV